MRAALRPGAIEFGQAQHLQRTGAVRQPANEAAFLKRRDQPMNAGFGREVERLLHLVEGGRDAALLQPFMDEHQQFMLLARQHRGPHDQNQKKQTQNKHYLFQLCSATV